MDLCPTGYRSLKREAKYSDNKEAFQRRKQERCKEIKKYERNRKKEIW